MSNPALAAATTVAALLAILSAPWALDLPLLNFVFKPLTTLFIIGFAARRGRATPLLRRWVLVGLVFSLAGDVALLWPQAGFVYGLGSFLLAHLAYLVAFTRRHGLAQQGLPFAIYTAVAAAVLWWLWPGVPAALRLPVAAYVICLAAMASQTAVLWRLHDPRAAVLALGGALFVASDALLASNKFGSPLPWASLWILSSYWAAQWCIASWLAPPPVAAGQPGTAGQ